MNYRQVLGCCLALSTCLTSCKSEPATPVEGEAKATASQATEPDEQKQTTLVRRTPTAAVEVDTTAPADIGTVPPGAKRSESGLAWILLKKGAGDAHPAQSDVALVNFIAWTVDGDLVQESLSRGRPAAIAIGSMVPGMGEGVQSMVKGEKRRLWIPGKLAFGEAKPGESVAADAPPLGMLVYDIELVGFRVPEPVVQAPAAQESAE